MFVRIKEHIILMLVCLVILGYVTLYFYCSYLNCNNWLSNIPKYLPPALFGLLLAYLGYRKAVSFLDTNRVFQLSDRCRATDIKIALEKDKIFPIFINQGGDALAYKDLVKNYDKSSGELKEIIREHLLGIYENITSSEKYFKWLYDIKRESKITNWKHLKPETTEDPKNDRESWDDFDVINVIKQTNEPNYWTTRGTCVKFLQNEEYLKGGEEFFKENWKLLEFFDWNLMFENLKKRLQSDRSLLVRKMALDTYIKLSGVERDAFIKDNIYHFDKAISHWENIENKENIISVFKKDIKIKE